MAFVHFSNLTDTKGHNHFLPLLPIMNISVPKPKKKSGYEVVSEDEETTEARCEVNVTDLIDRVVKKRATLSVLDRLKLDKLLNQLSMLADKSPNEK